jgi:hypothetical protein
MRTQPQDIIKKLEAHNSRLDKVNTVWCYGRRTR